MHSKLTALFQTIYGRPPEVVTRAPGRIEFIGNHTDYNGGSVLGAAINRGVWVGLARRDDGVRRFFSEFAGKITTLPVGELVRQSGPASWVNYPLGVLAALPAFGLPVPEGFDFLALSDLPAGAGLSSSAAIELASALAFQALLGSNPDRETVVKVGKHAENHFVGVPCGILDQGVSGFGRRDHLVYIDCRGPRFETVPLPPTAHFWIFNTHTKHALVDGLYASRHRECMEAARALGVGLLVEAKSAQLEHARPGLSPESYKRARHVIDEIERVESARQALRRGDLSTTGRLLTASHQSSQSLFENSTAELDYLVEMLAGGLNVYGARLTGGGFGGAVMALTSPAFGGAQAAAVASGYAERFGTRPDVLHAQTGPGAEVVLK
ncbi:MAG: galactokinase [Opitutaceae bacterium]